MSDKLLKIFFIILFSLTQLDLVAQIDSIKVEYTVENPEKSDFKFKEKYNYLQRRMIEEKSILKISLLDFIVNINDQGQYINLHSRGNIISYERKISPSFSLLYQNMFFFKMEFPKYQSFLNPGFPKTHILNSSSLGARYYYDQARRIAKGKSANNFSGNYVSLQFDNIIQIRVNYLAEDVNRSASKPTINLLYGIQRRLGKFGYFDFNLGMRYDEIDYNSPVPPPRKTALALVTNFAIGLGF